MFKLARELKVGDTFLLNSNDRDIFRITEFRDDRVYITGVNNTRKGFIDITHRVFHILPKYEYANYKKDRTSFKWTR